MSAVLHQSTPIRPSSRFIGMIETVGQVSIKPEEDLLGVRWYYVSAWIGPREWVVSRARFRNHGAALSFARRVMARGYINMMYWKETK